MSVALVVILWLIAPSAAIFNCEVDGLYANNDDYSCQTYFKCATLSNGTVAALLHYCRNGFKFDPEIKACTDDVDFNCFESFKCNQDGLYANRNDPSCKTYFSCNKIWPNYYLKSTFSCSGDHGFDVAKKTCVKNPDCGYTEKLDIDIVPIKLQERAADGEWDNGECTQKGRFPDLDDPTCTYYFLCSQYSNGTFIKTRYQCPTPHQFNPRIETCSNYYKCPYMPDTSSTTTELPATTPITAQPTTEPTTQTTTQTTSTQGPPLQKCVKRGYFPHIDDTTCTSYTFCDVADDGLIYPRDIKCPDNYYFNPNTNLCSKNYICPGKVIAFDPAGSFVYYKF